MVKRKKFEIDPKRTFNCIHYQILISKNSLPRSTLEARRLSRVADRFYQDYGLYFAIYSRNNWLADRMD